MNTAPVPGRSATILCWVGYRSGTVYTGIRNPIESYFCYIKMILPCGQICSNNLGQLSFNPFLFLAELSERMRSKFQNAFPIGKMKGFIYFLSFSVSNYTSAVKPQDPHYAVVAALLFFSNVCLWHPHRFNTSRRCSSSHSLKWEECSLGLVYQ